MRRLVVCLSVVVVTLVVAPTSFAHELGVVRVRLQELPAASYLMEAEMPPALATAIDAPELPERCTLDPEALGAPSETGLLRFTFACSRALTADDALKLRWQRQGAMVSAHWLDGTTARQFFSQSGDVIEVPLAALQAGSGGLLDAARRYTALGIEHILTGIDHLLFVLALLMIVRGPWMLVKTITAFTLAHSITLALATLGVVEVPRAPVEAAIALSIVFVAAEILHTRQGRPGLTARMPWLVAFAFGLLHGFGFAGALAELGLPKREIPLALMFFNLGVEIGQLIFVALVLTLRLAWQRLGIAWPRWALPLPAYVIGTVAALWLIERTSTLIVPS